MKLLDAKVTNFASYDRLEFKFDDLGISLIHGATGSGKSTLCDISCWILFGITAKNGSVDEVRSWSSDEPTTGVMNIQLNFGILTVHRTRGAPHQNDLYFIFNDDLGASQIRGKDLAETQRLLNQRLGFDAEGYILSSYYCEFSPSYDFFYTDAKHRQELFEKIANLDFVLMLYMDLSDAKKVLKLELKDVEIANAKMLGRVEQMKTFLVNALKNGDEWDKQQQSKIVLLKIKYDAYEAELGRQRSVLLQKQQNFQDEKEKKASILTREINTLSIKIVDKADIEQSLKDIATRKAAILEKVCPTCGGPLNSKGRDICDKEYEELQQLKLKNEARIAERRHKQEILDTLVNSENPFKRDLKALDSTNTRSVILRQLEDEKTQQNPFMRDVEQYKSSLEAINADLVRLTSDFTVKQDKLNSLIWLADAAKELQGVIMRKAIYEVERSTNNLLETHFESLFKVKFEIVDSSLDITILKEGNECSYKQLSKGQRRLLALCFGVSVMEITSSRLGQHFENLFFDESLDGLDADLKVKAFNLFTELEKTHKSIVVIDHSSELKEMFEKQFYVELQGDYSHIEEL